MSALPSLTNRFAGALVWLALSLVSIGAIVGLNYVQLRGEFETEARTLHRVVSQRADQHDAHLTSLATILAGPDDSFKTFRALADAVLRFYPRIKAIEVISTGDDPGVTFTTQDGEPATLNARDTAARARGLAVGQASVAWGANGTYHLVKRLPGGNPLAGALVMVVDGQRLVEPDGTPMQGVRLVLKDTSGRNIVQIRELSATRGPTFSFEKELGSRSQPLLLTLSRHPLLSELLPPLALVLALAGATVSVLMASFVLRERRTAREARERARFHEQEARLAHAMRVNTVGEMASGIAHELTQPLTAILSQSQAGLRLAQAPELDREIIIGVLEANARVAQRAGDILARLRAYVSNKTPAPELTRLNELVGNVAELVQADLAARGVSLKLDLSEHGPTCLIDRVSIEQVIHNLIRNAADAVEPLPQGERNVVIGTRLEKDTAVIVVEDSGPGLAADSLPRLFEPFFTTKKQGMGLGLPLCERLVEAYGGRITAANHSTRGAVFTVRLPLSRAAASREVTL